MTFPVVYDANVLYPPTLRHVLIQIAQTELVHARWTQEILDETFRNIQADNPHIDRARLLRTRELMCAAVPADSMRNPPATFNDVVDTLEGTGLPRAAALLRR